MPYNSPEDQKILDEEFLIDPRPGKAARKDIVSRVSLGDKEVQIWFQNRRQVTRKKMRQEGRDVSSSADNSSDPIHPPSPPRGGIEAENARIEQEQPAGTRAANEVRREEHVEVVNQTANAGPAASGIDPSPAPCSTVLPSSQLDVLPSDKATSSSQPTRSSGPARPPPSFLRTSSSQSGLGYVANRRVTNSFAEEPIMRRVQSTHDFRLSMTDDGKAKVVDRAKATPSPEKPRPSAVENAIVSRLGTLRRSYSAAGLDSSNSKAAQQDAARKFQRTSTLGRSRDSRTWEFWCDSDSRSTLITRAEQETSGSAIDAIGLIRSNSSRVLRLNTNKMNSPNPGHHRSSKRPAIQQAQTHHGIMKPRSLQFGESQKTTKKPDAEYEDLITESDKENNDPKSSRQRTSQPASSHSKKVLGEKTSAISHSSSLGSLMAREARGKASRGSANVGIHVDEEVASFMGGPRSGTATSAVEDLDCVQSLLSLSQGNWS